ncbi:nuclease-related domain-containing protein [Lentibacillus persicus]|nr:nuclease-related domain-containing protein [Lentibacillus persicus]
MEALNRRLRAEHYKKDQVEQKARNLRAGVKGEESLEFTLSFLRDDSLQILHNLRIRDQNEFFQIDNLIPSTKFILINEVKNIAGTVIYDEFGQAIRVSKNGNEENLGNHIEQVNLQHIRLLEWMRNNNYTGIPIEKLIVHSNPATIIKNPANNRAVTDTIIHKEQLLTKIDAFVHKHNAQVLSIKQLNHLSSLLIKAHTPKEVNVLEKFEIHQNDIMCGVFCPGCGALPMMRLKGCWICLQCQLVSKNAHLPALKDYFLLFGNKINNREARRFLNVESQHVVKRILHKEGFEFTGNTTKRFYFLPF